jgi:transcription elongation factor Elf1
MFKCPVCGSNSYSISLRVKNSFKCNGCTVSFETPSKFGRVNITKNEKDTTVVNDKAST